MDIVAVQRRLRAPRVIACEVEVPKEVVGEPRVVAMKVLDVQRGVERPEVRVGVGNDSEGRAAAPDRDSRPGSSPLVVPASYAERADDRNRTFGALRIREIVTTLLRHELAKGHLHPVVARHTRAPSGWLRSPRPALRLAPAARAAARRAASSSRRKARRRPRPPPRRRTAQV